MLKADYVSDDVFFRVCSDPLNFFLFLFLFLYRSVVSFSLSFLLYFSFLHLHLMLSFHSTSFPFTSWSLYCPFQFFTTANFSFLIFYCSLLFPSSCHFTLHAHSSSFETSHLSFSSLSYTFATIKAHHVSPVRSSHLPLVLLPSAGLRSLSQICIAQSVVF